VTLSEVKPSDLYYGLGAYEFSRKVPEDIYKAIKQNQCVVDAINEAKNKAKVNGTSGKINRRQVLPAFTNHPDLELAIRGTDAREFEPEPYGLTIEATYTNNKYTIYVVVRDKYDFDLCYYNNIAEIKDVFVCTAVNVATIEQWLGTITPFRVTIAFSYDEPDSIQPVQQQPSNPLPQPNPPSQTVPDISGTDNLWFVGGSVYRTSTTSDVTAYVPTRWCHVAVNLSTAYI